MELIFKGEKGSLRGLSSDLKTASNRVGGKAANVLRRRAAAVARDAARNAPRQSGALAASMTTTFSGNGRSGAMTAAVGPTVRYGGFVELGTSKMAARPYLFPALDANSEDLASDLADVADEILP